MFAFLSLLIAATTPVVAPAPATSHEARNGSFHVLQLAVPDLDAFDREWSVPTPGVNVTSTDKLVRNTPTFSVILFSGCKRDTRGHCRLSVSYRVLDPSRALYQGQKPETVAAYDAEVTDPAQFYMTSAVLGLRIEPGEALGKYRIEATTIDLVAGKSVTTWTTLDAVEAQ